MSKKLFFLVLTILIGTSWGCGSDMNGIWKQLKEGNGLSMANIKVGKGEAEILSAGHKEGDGMSNMQIEKVKGDIFSSRSEDLEEDGDWGMPQDTQTHDTSSEKLSPIRELAKSNTDFGTFFAAMKGINNSLEEENVVGLRKKFGAGAGRAPSFFTVNKKSPLHQTFVRLSANVFNKENDYKGVPNTALSSGEEKLRDELLKKGQLAMIKASNSETERLNKAGRQGRRDPNKPLISYATQRQWIRQAQYDKAFKAIDQFIDETCTNPLEDLRKIMPVLCSFWQAVGAIAMDNDVVPDGYNNKAAFDEEAKVLHNFHYAAVKLLKDDTLCNCEGPLKNLYDEYEEKEVE